jgi:hypothetical protein
MNILEEAEMIIYGDREKTYGHPAVNLERVALLWQAYLAAAVQDKETFEFSAENVAWMMVLLKMARQINESKRDNLVDAAGYIALIERIEDGSSKNKS